MSPLYLPELVYVFNPSVKVTLNGAEPDVKLSTKLAVLPGQIVCELGDNPPFGNGRPNKVIIFENG